MRRAGSLCDLAVPQNGSGFMEMEVKEAMALGRQRTTASTMARLRSLDKSKRGEMGEV